MRIVIALGGNALLKRGQAMSQENQQANVETAARAIAPLVAEHEVVITHGNGPQVGLLSLQSHAYERVDPYSLDVLGAETEGMIGYMLERELGNLLPAAKPLATILTMIEVDPNDPAFRDPTKFVGPIYEKAQANQIATEKGWVMKPDGDHWRRVVPSPAPRRVFEIRPIRWLLEKGVLVICAGGGGIPTAYTPGRERDLEGIEAVIDKDFASELLARDLDADLFIMATDVDGVYRDWGTPTQIRIDEIRISGLETSDFPAGSMGPKVEAAAQFVRRAGKVAAIGSLDDIQGIVMGTKGTRFVA
ncbi:MAG TPA: carbamate kinase [Thermomicrobiales bacterium]|nr:carbamate kinase [Thermomicrobiales bacterium]